MPCIHSEINMRLLYITNGIHGAAGLERVLSVKASYLADILGYDIHIMTLNSAGKVPFYDFSKKITFHNIAASGNPLQYIKQYLTGIINTASSVSPDVVSVCDDGLKGFFFPQITRKKYRSIYERHVSKNIELGHKPNVIKKLKTSLAFGLMNNLAAHFDRFVVLTKDNVSEWNLKNIIVISNPLSFEPEGYAALDNRKVIAVGRQSYQKGFDRLLEIWAIIQQKHPDWKLEIYGKSDDSLRLPIIAEELGIAQSVSFFEPERNIQQKYMEASIYALSSRFEGFGMVLVEAMICGVPCVSFDCPCGPSDIIKNGEDGFLVENDNIGLFASKLSILIEDANKRKMMGRKAKENVKRYLPEKILSQWDELFKSIVE